MPSFPYFGSNPDFPFWIPGTRGEPMVFEAGYATAPRWQTWEKPRGITMVSMLLIGGGGGGGAGFTGLTNTARGGGAGGACAGISFHIFPAYLLPDILKVYAGPGGAGGSGSGISGAAGQRSIVAVGDGITSGLTIPNIIAESTSTNPGGGIAGSNTGNAVGGTVPNIGAKVNAGWAQVFCVSTFTNGIVGATGGAASGAAGTPVANVWNLIPLSPGSGGGGVTTTNQGFAGGTLSLQSAMDFADGGFTPASNFLAGGTAGSNVLVGGPGNPGVQSFRPLVMTGGTGGGSADGQAGGAGGNGGIGCGGGGGGGGTTGGRGGNGGNGIVVITSW